LNRIRTRRGRGGRGGRGGREGGVDDVDAFLVEIEHFRELGGIMECKVMR
jgi:hypothetical protein